MSVASEVLETVRGWPGITSPQLKEVMQLKNPHGVDSTLHYLVKQGRLRRDGIKRPQGYYIATKDAPKPITTDAGDKIRDLQAKVAELEAWKADAIARYPDLGIPPLLKRARQIAAKRFKSEPAHSDIVSGRKDNSALILAIMDALEGEE